MICNHSNHLAEINKQRATQGLPALDRRQFCKLATALPIFLSLPGLFGCEQNSQPNGCGQDGGQSSTEMDYHTTSNDLFTAEAADGVTLKLKRYRPTEQSGFRKGAQPVLLFSGIGVNMNEYLAHTPEKKKAQYKNMKLPAEIADWAVDEPFVSADPMRYYSIAHYLWVKGYDVWMANYRNTGRGKYRSETGKRVATLDEWAVLDTPVCIDKVIEATGKNPVIGGHSTGGLVAYLYLSGLTADIDLLVSHTDRYASHMQFDKALAQERNQKIKGFIGLDPAGQPPLPFTGIIDTRPIWRVLGSEVSINVDSLMEEMLGDTNMRNVPAITVQMFMNFIANRDEIREVQEQFDLFGALHMWEVKNTNTYVNDFFLRYGTSSIYLRGFAQYADWGVNHLLREFYQNGESNQNVIVPPKPNAPRNNLVSYDQVGNMTVPAISIFSESDSLVKTDYMVKYLMEGKTAHPNDEWYELPGSAHVDVPFGNSSPTFTFVKIGAWLEKIVK